MSKPAKLPSRSKRLGVGKEIGGNIYLHRQYEDLLGNVVCTAKTKLLDTFEYDIVKLNYANNAVTFTRCNDFDGSHEPEVGDSILVKPDGTKRSRRRLNDPYIYHHKWLMVKDDYLGFDIEESKRRSRAWIALPNVDRNRIGRKSYWNSIVVPRIKPEVWLTSEQLRKRRRLSTCELAHLRQRGELVFRKSGNAFLYLEQDAQLHEFEE